MNVLTKAVVQGAACGLMIGAVLLVGERVWRPAPVAAQAPAVADVVRARSFQAVDAAGKTRLSLDVLPDGTSGLGLFDGAEKLRVDLGVNSHGSPDLALYDAAGKTRASLSMLSDGTPALRLYDATEKARAVLGTTSLEVVKTGEERTRSESSLVLFGKDGKVIWEAP